MYNSIPDLEEPASPRAREPGSPRALRCTISTPVRLIPDPRCLLADVAFKSPRARELSGYIYLMPKSDPRRAILEETMK